MTPATITPADFAPPHDDVHALFPPDFRWGTATAAYQVEGAWDADGRGPSIWDTFCRRAGKIAGGTNGNVAVDHYNRWPEDIALMRQMSLDSYRLSISWSRVLPSGRGPVNAPGLAFYDRLIDGLLEAGITPFVTLFHWDLPQALQDQGGWVRRGIVDDYVAYVDVVTRRLGDRVTHWMTLNEPYVYTWVGHFVGIHAPGEQTLNVQRPLTISHHLLLAHGRAVPVIRDNVPGAQVGIAQHLSVIHAASPAASDVEAAVRTDLHLNRWYLDPLFKGAYPQQAVEMYGVFMPEIHDGDMEAIAAPLDFLGVNYYTRQIIGFNILLPVLQARTVSAAALGAPVTAMSWEVYPDGLVTMLTTLHAEYDLPALYISENGAAFDDEPPNDRGRVHDKQRVAYLRSHFAAASEAIRAGVPLKGYFVWTLMDNFEWSEGFTKRFGVVYVDHNTQERTLKDSGLFLGAVAARTRQERARLVG